MRVIATLSIGGEEAKQPLIVKRLAEEALVNVEREFGREGADFAVAIHPGIGEAEIVVTWDNTGALQGRQIAARMPLASVSRDLGFDEINYDWGN